MLAGLLSIGLLNNGLVVEQLHNAMFDWKLQILFLWAITTDLDLESLRSGVEVEGSTVGLTSTITIRP